MSVRRRAIAERKARDGMRRAEYERTMRWMDNMKALLERKSLRVALGETPTVSLEEVAACFDPPVTTASAIIENYSSEIKPDSAPDRCKHGVWAADHCYQCEADTDGKEKTA